ncbi:MAG: peptidase [Frankiales bacterium]|nr:peptidase [Frankiales bacterium]
MVRTDPSSPLIATPAAPAAELPDRLVELAETLISTWGSWAPTLTPDASRMAFISDRRGTPELWVQEVGSLTEPGQAPPPRLITLSADPVVAVRWSPDEQWLACAVATGGGVRTQVWVVRPDGTQARRLAGSATEHAVLGPWTRSGHRLVITFPGPGSADHGSAAQDSADHGSAEPESGEPNGAHSRCVLIDPVSGVSQTLATGELIDVLDLSRDERYVLLRDGERGAQFCVMLDREHDVSYRMLPYPDTGSTDLGKFRPSPPGERHPLTVYFVSDAGRPRRELIAQGVADGGERGPAGTLARRDDAELELLDADAQGRLLSLVWNVAGASEVELLDTATGQRRLVSGLPGFPGSDCVVSDCVLSRDGSSAMLCVEGPASPRALWRLDTATLSITRVSDRPAAAMPALVTPTLERFVAHDGLPLTGWLYRAVGGRPGPAMLSLHGGPEAQERPVFSPQHQLMAAAGVTVFAPNVRGSSGYGHAFVHADDRYGRYDAIADVASCVGFLTDSGLADPAQVAVTGRSYGGYLTLAAMVKYPELFAAGVDICGMSDLLRFYRDTEPWIAAAAVSKYGHPEHDASLLKALSPLSGAASIAAPLLVVHGELDTNVPIGQALDIVRALQDLGRPVEYLQLAGEGHEYRRADSRLSLMEAMASFLVRHLS